MVERDIVFFRLFVCSEVCLEGLRNQVFSSRCHQMGNLVVVWSTIRPPLWFLVCCRRRRCKKLQLVNKGSFIACKTIPWHRGSVLHVLSCFYLVSVLLSQLFAPLWAWLGKLACQRQWFNRYGWRGLLCSLRAEGGWRWKLPTSLTVSFMYVYQQGWGSNCPCVFSAPDCMVQQCRLPRPHSISCFFQVLKLHRT